VTLYGIDSVMAPLAKRDAAWQQLARDLDRSKLEAITQEVGLAEALNAGPAILAGKVRGRLVVNVNA
jgi:acrylyl-CoA reductase (NADPH)